jgi:hypothetical protein
VLDVLCNRCERYDRLRNGTLLSKHGPALAVPTLRGIVAADCLRMIENRMHDVCGVHFPQLSRLVWWGKTGSARLLRPCRPLYVTL